MVNIAGQTVDISGFFSTGTSHILFWFAVVIILLIIAGVATYLFIRRLKFNRRVVLLEDVSGSDDLEPIGNDRAMLVSVAKSGMEVLYLRKRKKYVGAYGKRMGKNTYYFAIGPDGYWYNVTLGSLKEGMQSIHMNPTHVNMRYQNEALQEVIKARYDKEGFWQKYGGMIAFVGLIVIFGMMSYILISKFGEVANTLNKIVETLPDLVNQVKSAVGALDAAKSGGSGIVPAQLWQVLRF